MRPVRPAAGWPGAPPSVVCRKVVATDCADAIIADPSSLKAGIAWWKELSRGDATTKGVGWMMDAPVQYRMADWENVAVNRKSRFLSVPNESTSGLSLFSDGN